jgi:Glycosyltransferase 61
MAPALQPPSKGSGARSCVAFFTVQRLLTIVLTTALVIGLQKVASIAFLGSSLSPTFYRKASFVGGPRGTVSLASGSGDKALKPGDGGTGGSAENCPKCADCKATAVAPSRDGAALLSDEQKKQALSPTTGVNLLPENPWLTQQQCFENSDETEICIWRGPVCMTNKDQIIVSRERRPDYGSHDPRSWCPDHRAYRRTYECKNKRPNLPEEAYKNPDKWMHEAGTIPLMPNERRRWGAQDSQGDIKEVPFESLIKASDPKDIEELLGPRWAEVAKTAEFSHLPEVGKEIGIATINMPKKVRWLGKDKGVYFANMRGEWIDHIWHWSTAAFPLFDAKRQNRSTLNVPGFSMEPGHFNLNMGKLSLPPMDYVVMFGRFPRPVKSIKDFPKWMQNVWPALSQEQTVLLANGVFSDPASEYHLPDDELLCTTHAVFSSFKSSLFTGQRDAHVFKQLAYAKAGVNIPAYGRYPPRQITVMTRSSRGLYNIEEILEVLKETGLPVKVINDMGALTWQQQVQVMAETGILVAVHGAALTNVIFMPANAVLVEVRMRILMNRG